MEECLNQVISFESLILISLKIIKKPRLRQCLVSSLGSANNLAAFVVFAF